jgi:predicted AAA+ superfamily ATPase
MMGHLTDAFLFSTVPLATESERQRNTNPRKVYPADPGLVGAFDVSGRTNVGHSLETVVLHELERRRTDIAYVRNDDGTEVDFLARAPGARPMLVQVCADVAEAATLAREAHALAAAGRDHPRAERVLLVPDKDAAARAAASGVTARPLADWLLE